MKNCSDCWKEENQFSICEASNIYLSLPEMLCKQMEPDKDQSLAQKEVLEPN